MPARWLSVIAVVLMRGAELRITEAVFASVDVTETFGSLAAE
jgi:hypothetical protein